MDVTTDWRVAFIDSLVEVDELAPHGLYGIRHAYDQSGGSNLPPLSRIFARSEFENAFAARGISKRRGHDRPACFSFCEPEGGIVQLTIWDRASTKVRQFGTEFRYDPQSKKTAQPVPIPLKKFLPKLEKYLRQGTIPAMLLIDHHAEKKDSIEVPDGDFLERYELCYRAKSWNDRFGRRFDTVLHLWSPK